MVGHFLSVQIVDAIQEGFGGRQAIDLVVIDAQHEGDPNIRKSLEKEGMTDMRVFRLRGTEKLAACGHIEKEIPDGDVGSAGRARIAHLLDFAAKNQDFRPYGGVGAVGCERELGNGCDGGKGFPSESHGGDGVEILELTKLAGGMTLNAQQCVVAIHASPIVQNPDQSASPIHHFDLNACGSGIEGILDQLLQNGCRAFHDLARGNLVDHRVRQHLDGSGFAHGKIRLAKPVPKQEEKGRKNPEPRIQESEWETGFR